MIEAVNKTMLDLQRTLLTKVLYPSGDHVKTCQDRACKMVWQILEERQKIDIFVLGNRVIFDDKTLPSSANLVKGLFGLIYRNGVDRITFQRGIEEWEIQSLLDELAASKSEGPRRLKATAHITFSYISVGDGEDTAQFAGGAQILEGTEIVGAVSGLLQEIDTGDGFNANILSDIVTSIAKIVSDNDIVLLPLTAVKKHDEYTFIHATNVAILTTALSESLGFDDSIVHELCMAALLHDIGKLHIPVELLNKNGKLTDGEFELIKTHPVEGARRLFETPGTPQLAQIVAYEHHMHVDGNGYPKVPSGWKLNLASRIIHVTDVFDALRTHRAYRKSMPVPKIIEIMQSEAGTSFDPDLLDVFIQQIALRYNPAESECNSSICSE